MFHKFKKGSPEAKAHMAKLRAMVGKKRKKNPLTRSEAAHQITQARYTLTNAKKSRGQVRHELAGEAVGRMAAVEAHGPAAAREASLKMARRAMRVSLGVHTHGRKGNPQFCANCGAMPGYSHSPSCPRPDFTAGFGGHDVTPCTCGVRELPHYDAPKDRMGYLVHRRGCPSAKFNFGPAVPGGAGARKKNPLTRKESGQLLREARIRTHQATMHKKDWRREYYGGMAQGLSDAVEAHGPDSSKSAARKMQDRADRAVGIGRWTGREVNPRRRKKNPPLLVLGNPGRRGKRPASSRHRSSFGECPKGFPSHVWRDPQFQRELKVFRGRHGANVPIHITKVKMPPGSPKFMTAYGKAQHAVYDAPKGRKDGRKYIHHFGKKGKSKPWLVSSASKGPKWLGYAGGSFNAKTKWLYW